MTNRVIMDSTKLLVSKSGIDVNSSQAIGENLIFDSRSGKYLGVFMTGVLTENLFTQISSEVTGTPLTQLRIKSTYQYKLILPKVFAKPPITFFSFQSVHNPGNILASTPNWSESSEQSYFDGRRSQTIGGSISFSAINRTTEIVFEYSRNQTSGYPNVPGPPAVSFMVAHSS